MAKEYALPDKEMATAPTGYSTSKSAIRGELAPERRCVFSGRIPGRAQEGLFSQSSVKPDKNW